MDPLDIENRFVYHDTSSRDKPYEHTVVREECRRLADKLNEVMPDGREKSLAITRLEEVLFWANAGIARSIAL